MAELDCDKTFNGVILLSNQNMVVSLHGLYLNNQIPPLIIFGAIYFNRK